MSLEEVDALAKFVVENCLRLEFCGFMTIGSPNYNTELGPNPEYQMLVDIRDRVAALYSHLHLELSMGMSKDFLHAVSTNIFKYSIKEKCNFQYSLILVYTIHKACLIIILY